MGVVVAVVSVLIALVAVGMWLAAIGGAAHGIWESTRPGYLTPGEKEGLREAFDAAWFAAEDESREIEVDMEALRADLAAKPAQPQKVADDERPVPVRVAAEAIGVAAATIYGWIRQGRLSSLRPEEATRGASPKLVRIADVRTLASKRGLTRTTAP